MRNRIERAVAVALTASSMALAACGGGDNRQLNTSRGDVTATPTTSGYAADTTATAAPKHHSKLAGAAVGAVAGHMLGGHAVAGAAAGALIQHERNKHSR